MVCDRFHCLPGEAMEEEAGVLRLLRIEQLGTKQERQPEGGEFG